MKYIVVATVWSEKYEVAVKVPVGTFDKFNFAAMFRDAYNAKYKADAEVVAIADLLNA